MSAVLPAPLAPAATGAGPAGGRFALGKYREIVVAVAFFLLFDLGVLVLNFYTSFQIAEDAVGINLAGRQRMLSQRTAKALLSVQAARSQGLPARQELDELGNAVRLFDVSLKGFQAGATVPGGDGHPVFLPAAQGARAAEILAKAQALWTPYQQRLAPVLAGAPTEAELQAAADYAKTHNLQLLGLMNELTTALEAVAAQRATTLRLVQTGGIVLALLNFAFILFKFLRRLRSSDAAIEAANEENREILASVREGLFLMTPDFRLGSQLSQSARQLFGRALKPGDPFFELLSPLVSEKVLRDARDYVELLFSPHVKEALVQDINPLSEVELMVKNRLGQDQRRHLSFHFNRVQEDGAVRHLLVTVQDITARMELAHKLQAERQRSQKELSMLLKALDADPALLHQFVTRAEAGLLEVNELLRGTASARGEAAVLAALDQAARRVHALKGDAATLGLETLAGLAHAFETGLQRIRESGGSGDLGEALLALPLPLEELLGQVAALKGLAERPRGSEAKPVAGEASEEALARLAQQVASDQGKRVRAQVSLDGLNALAAETRDRVHEIAVQLLRNAVVHGIEAPALRRSAGKDAEGCVELQLQRAGAEWQLSVRDDGAGLSAPLVRQKLLALGWYSPLQLEQLDDRQVIAHIFRPGFSTADGLSLHAGRGVGLDLVQTHVQQLGARIKLSATPGRFTEFRIRFAA